MKRLFAIFAAALALCGCSTTYLQRTLDKGEYADAYKMVFAAGPNSSLFEERQKTTANIRDKTGGEGGNSFAKSLSNFITGSNWTPTLAEDFLQVKQMFDTALTDRLISRLQHKDLMDELLFRLANDSISKPSLLTQNARAEFPEAEKYRTKIALSEIEKLQADPSANLNRYITLYSFFVEVKEPVATQRVKAAMQGKVTLQMQQPGGLQNVDAGQAIVDYIKLTGDHSFDTLFITALSKINLSKNELTTGYIPEMFPAFSIDEVKKRTIRLNIASQNDEFIVGEIIEQLKQINPWLEIADEAKHKITLGRIRFQENRTSPTNMTETVAQPNFVTLLLIPKNASVLFDYTVTDYSLQWNLGAVDSLSKATKSFSGNRNAKQVECRNFRYQNVFGGTGAIYGMPSDGAANFCSANSNVNFDAIRSSAINQIASEINNTFLQMH